MSDYHWSDEDLRYTKRMIDFDRNGNVLLYPNLPTHCAVCGQTRGHWAGCRARLTGQIGSTVDALLSFEIDDNREGDPVISEGILEPLEQPRKYGGRLQSSEEFLREWRGDWL
jgi:hypothetical protein